MNRPCPAKNPRYASCLNADMWKNCFLFLTILCSGLANSHAQQDPLPVRRAIDDWLKTQLKGLPGDISHEIGMPATVSQLAPCSRFDVTRPPSAQGWGRGHVVVRCLDAAGWRITVPIHVRIKSDYLIAARPITQGQTISADDLAFQTGDLSELPARIVTDDRLALGKMAAVTIAAGSPLRTDMLKAMAVIRQGQTVKVVSRGNGFEVTNEGRALNNAAEGQLAQIKMANGQILSGMAKSGGSVEVTF